MHIWTCMYGHVCMYGYVQYVMYNSPHYLCLQVVKAKKNGKQ